MNEDNARLAHAKELVEMIRAQARTWMRADQLTAPYDGKDVITESTRLALWRLGFGHLDPTDQPEPAQFKYSVHDEIPEPVMAQRMGALARRHRAEAAEVEASDPIGATILRAKADMISESLIEAGYDADGEPRRHS